MPTNRNLRTDMPEGELPHRSIVADGQTFRPSLDQHLPGITLTEREGTIWRGDWIAGFSWLRREGAFADIPGGPIFDLSFSDVVPHHLLTSFRPWEFGSTVLAGVVCGWVHKPPPSSPRNGSGVGACSPPPSGSPERHREPIPSRPRCSMRW